MMEPMKPSVVPYLINVRMPVLPRITSIDMADVSTVDLLVVVAPVIAA
jgi:hypothetical protein